MNIIHCKNKAQFIWQTPGAQGLLEVYSQLPGEEPLWYALYSVSFAQFIFDPQR